MLHDGIRTVTPLIGEPIRVPPCQLQKGALVDVDDISGEVGSYWVLALLWNERNFSDPMVLLGTVPDASEF